MQGKVRAAGQGRARVRLRSKAAVSQGGAASKIGAQQGKVGPYEAPATGVGRGLYEVGAQGTEDRVRPCGVLGAGTTATLRAAEPRPKAAKKMVKTGKDSSFTLVSCRSHWSIL